MSLDYTQHKQAEQTLRLAKKTSLDLPSSELAYNVRLAKKTLHRDRLASKRIKTSLEAEDKESEIED